MQVLAKKSGIASIVDDEDFEMLDKHTWHSSWSKMTSSFYLRTNTEDEKGYCTISMHRMVMGCKRGDKKEVDHINLDTLDNRKQNLRFVTRSQNQLNRDKLPRNKSGFKGVIAKVDRSGRPRFVSNIRIHGKLWVLGTFDTAEQASEAYKARLAEEFA